jgi:iron complex outermembrane receptor protein
VGSKNPFIEDSLQLNGAVFYFDYGGAVTQVQPDNNNPTATFTLTVSAKAWGVELKMLYQLTSQDRFGFNYAFVQSRYVDEPARFAAEIPGRIVRSPAPRRTTINPTNTALTNPSVGPGLMNYVYMDSGAIGNFNLNWSAADGRFGVGAYVRNFTDHRWISYDVRALTPLRQINATETTPRTYGVTLFARF